MRAADPERVTTTANLAQAVTRGLEVPGAARAGEKLPEKFYINNSKPAESVGGKTFPRSNLPR